MQVVYKQKLFYVFCVALLVAPLCAVVNEDDFLSQSNELVDVGDIVRLVVEENLILNESLSSEVGNVTKKITEDGIVKTVRFINNWGGNNTFLGIRSGNNFKSIGASNAALGTNALRNLSSGSNNTAVGANALRKTTEGSSNVAIGSLALTENTTGIDNVAIGVAALASNISGSRNVAIGRGTLSASASGGDNVAIGYQALLLSEGNNNVAIGGSAGRNMINGNDNLFIGSSAGLKLVSGDGNIYVGSSGKNVVGSESSTLRIGDAAVSFNGCYIQGIFYSKIMPNGSSPLRVSPEGQLAGNQASLRFKHTVKEMGDESGRIYKLRPVTFVYNQDETETRQFGLIAEEVDELFPELVTHDRDGAPYSVHYEMLPVLLLNEIKKEGQRMRLQGQSVDRLRRVVQELREEIQMLITQ